MSNIHLWHHEVSLIILCTRVSLKKLGKFDNFSIIPNHFPRPLLLVLVSAKTKCNTYIFTCSAFGTFLCSYKDESWNFHTVRNIPWPYSHHFPNFMTFSGLKTACMTVGTLCMQVWNINDDPLDCCCAAFWHVISLEQLLIQSKEL